MPLRSRKRWTSWREDNRRILSLLLLLAALFAPLTHIPALPLLVRVPLALLTINFLPGLSLLLLAGRRRANLSRISAQSLLISPVIATGWVILFYKAGCSFTASLLVLQGAVLGGLLAGLRRKPWVITWHRRRAPLLAVALLFFFLLLAIPPLANLHLRAYYNAFKDIAVMKSIFLSGVPPVDPFFAGKVSIYYWWFHAYAGALHKLSGLDPLTSFMVINLLAMASLFTGLQLLAKRILAQRHEKVFGLLCALFGLNALGAFILLFHLNEAGEALRRVDHNLLVNFFRLMTAGWDLRTGTPLAKFYNVNSVPLCCALVVGFLEAVLGILRERRQNCGIQAAFCLAGLMNFHLLSGPLVLASAAGGILLTWLMAKRPFFFLIRKLAPPLAAGFLIGLPYLLSIFFSGWQKNAAISFPWRKILHLLGPYFFLAPFLVHTAWIWLREKRTDRIFFLFFLLCGFAAFLPLKFPVNTQYKFLIFLSYPAGLASGFSLARIFTTLPLRARRLFYPALLALLLPTSLVTIFLHFYFASAFGRVREKVPMFFSIRGDQVVLEDANGEMGKAASFIQSSSPPDAVFIDKMRYEFLSFCGRRSFLSNPAYLVDGFPEYSLRRAIVEGIYLLKKKPHPQTADCLKRLGKPVYFIFRKRDERNRKVLWKKLSSLPMRMRALFRSPGITIAEATFPNEPSPGPGR